MSDMATLSRQISIPRWQQLSSQLLDSHRVVFDSVIKGSERLAVLASYLDVLNTEELLHLHGARSLFRSVSVPFEKGGFYIPKALSLLYSVCYSSHGRDDSIRDLQLLGNALTGDSLIFGKSTDFFVGPGLDHGSFGRHNKGVIREFDDQIFGSAWFSVFIISALELEHATRHSNAELGEEVAKTLKARQENGTLLSSVAQVLLARAESRKFDSQGFLEKLKLSNEQTKVVDDWCHQRRNFMESQVPALYESP